MQISFKREVIEKSRKTPVVVDFFSNWCTPCLALAPILERLEKEYKGKFILVKVNVDNNRELTDNYSIMSIPHVKMFKNGEIIDEFIGALSEKEVRKWLNKNLI